MTPRITALVLALFAISVPFLNQAIELGAAVTPSHLAGLALVALAAATWIKRRYPIPKDLALQGIFASVLIATVSVVRVQLAPDIQLFGESTHAKSLKQWVGLGFGVSVFMALYCLLRWYRLGATILRIHYWTTAAFGLAALVQYLVAVVDINSPLANFPVQNSTLGGTRALSLMYGFPRVSLTLVEPSILATYLLSGCAIWMYGLDRPPFASRSARRWFIAAGFVLSASVIVSGSRMAYIVFGLLALGALIARPLRARRVALVGGSMVLGFLLTGPAHARGLMASLVPTPPPPGESTIAELPHPSPSPADGIAGLNDVQESDAAAVVSGDGARTVPSATRALETTVAAQDLSVQQRAASYLVAISVLQKRPLLGTGFGTSSFYMQRYWPSSFFTVPDRSVAPTMMSHYATIATETGLAGVVCVMVIFIGLLIPLRQLSRRSEDGSVLAWVAGASVASYGISSVATALVLYQFLLIWLLLAIAVSVSDSPRDIRGDASADPTS